MAGKTVVVYRVPKLVNNRGTLPINRSYQGVGRIRVASGTADSNTYIAILKAMDGVFNAGNLDTLEAIRDRVVTPLDLLQSVKKNGVNKVVNINVAVPLISTVQHWLENYDIKQSTRRGYRSHLAGLFKRCTATDTLKDLPKRLEAYRKVCSRNGTAVTFNHCRTALLAFAREEYKKRSQVYGDISAVEVLKVKKKLYNDAVSVTEAVKFTGALEDPFPTIIWHLLYSGLRISEFLEALDTSWEVQVDRIQVTNADIGHGNKGGSREVFLAYPIEKSPRQIKAIRKAFSKARMATGINITPHTTRKCFAYWCDESGISDVRIEAYMGHKSLSLTQMYKKHEVDAHLADDAKRFRDYVEGIRNPEPVAPRKKTVKMVRMGPYGMETVEVDVQ